jgi:adenylate kinase family enzyme
MLKTPKSILSRITNSMPKVYFSGSVRGKTDSTFDLTTQIGILSKIVDVTTKHMSNPKLKDIEHYSVSSDESIYLSDQKLLSESDCVISECSQPSLGVGFMMSQGLKLHKPILCIYRDDIKLSAMINGCRDIIKGTYNDKDSYIKQIINFLLKNNLQPRTHRIFMCGPPGSGKSTISKMLSDKYGLLNISSGSVVRNILKMNNDMSEKIRLYVDKGELIPSELMIEIIIPVITSPTALYNGFILDGYPPSKEDLTNLEKYNIYPDIVFYFNCSDETAIKRQCMRKERITDTEEIAKKRVDIFRKNISSYEELYTQWFPTSIVINVDVENYNLDEIFEYIIIVYHNLLFGINDKSYFPIPLQNESELKSTRFHMHIDSSNTQNIENWIKLFYNLYPEYHGQLKIYLIRNLNVCSQTKTYNVYQNMINFHNIDDSSSESFITARMGEYYDKNFMNALLKCSELYNRYDSSDFMIELEEYVYEIEYFIDKIVSEVRYTPVPFVRDNKYDYLTLPFIPKYELHHGFDIEYNDKLQIDLDMLKNECEKYDFDNGGWFVFRNNKNAYRSNEFFNGSLEEAIDKLNYQTKCLHKIVESFGYTVKIISNIEIVHCIWRT